MSKLELSMYWIKNPYDRAQVKDLIGTRCLYGIVKVRKCSITN